MDVITRKEASSLNLPYYFTGKPCKRGHVAKRVCPYGACVECVPIQTKEWNQKNRTRANAKAGKWRVNNQEKVVDSRIKNIYGVSLDHIENLYDAQCGKCALCGEPVSRDKIQIDHCHKTRVVRGLLCRKCNIGLGMFNEDSSLIEKAVSYINQFKI